MNFKIRMNSPIVDNIVKLEVECQNSTLNEMMLITSEIKGSFENVLDTQIFLQSVPAILYVQQKNGNKKNEQEENGLKDEEKTKELVLKRDELNYKDETDDRNLENYITNLQIEENLDKGTKDLEEEIILPDFEDHSQLEKIFGYKIKNMKEQDNKLEEKDSLIIDLEDNKETEIKNDCNNISYQESADNEENSNIARKNENKDEIKDFLKLKVNQELITINDNKTNRLIKKSNEVTGTMLQVQNKSKMNNDNIPSVLMEEIDEGNGDMQQVFNVSDRDNDNKTSVLISESNEGTIPIQQRDNITSTNNDNKISVFIAESNDGNGILIKKSDEKDECIQPVNNQNNKKNNQNTQIRNVKNENIEAMDPRNHRDSQVLYNESEESVKTLKQINKEGDAKIFSNENVTITEKLKHINNNDTGMSSNEERDISKKANNIDTINSNETLQNENTEAFQEIKNEVYENENTILTHVISLPTVPPTYITDHFKFEYSLLLKIYPSPKKFTEYEIPFKVTSANIVDFNNKNKVLIDFESQFVYKNQNKNECVTKRKYLESIQESNTHRIIEKWEKSKKIRLDKEVDLKFHEETTGNSPEMENRIHAYLSTYFKPLISNLFPVYDQIVSKISNKNELKPYDQDITAQNGENRSHEIKNRTLQVQSNNIIIATITIPEFIMSFEFFTINIQYHFNAKKTQIKIRRIEFDKIHDIYYKKDIYLKSYNSDMCMENNYKVCLKENACSVNTLWFDAAYEVRIQLNKHETSFTINLTGNNQ